MNSVGVVSGEANIAVRDYSYLDNTGHYVRHWSHAQRSCIIRLMVKSSKHSCD